MYQQAKNLSDSYLGVYQVGCNYGGYYIGGTRNALARSRHHQDDSMTEKWESSGSIEYSNLVMDSLIGCTLELD